MKVSNAQVIGVEDSNAQVIRGVKVSNVQVIKGVKVSKAQVIGVEVNT